MATNASTNQDLVPAQLHCGIVVRVREDVCDIARDGQLRSVRYATLFPSPRTKRVSPGHLVAIATAPDRTGVVIWRWYDAVVIGEETGLIRLWEPSHGEVLAQPRPAYQSHQPGTRAYLSAGLPGAAWWVAGGTAASAEDAALARRSRRPLVCVDLRNGVPDAMKEYRGGAGQQRAESQVAGVAAEEAARADIDVTCCPEVLDQGGHVPAVAGVKLRDQPVWAAAQVSPDPEN